jgi:hypothetical protein
MRKHFREGKKSNRGKRDASTEFGRKGRGAWRARFGELRVSVKRVVRSGAALERESIRCQQGGASVGEVARISLLEEGDGHLMLSAGGEDVAVNAVIVVEGLREFQRAVRRIRCARRRQAKALRPSEPERGQKSPVANSSGTIDAAGDSRVSRR